MDPENSIKQDLLNKREKFTRDDLLVNNNNS